MCLMMGWLALAIIFAGVFVIEELDHDCTGEDCHICLQIEIAQRLLEAFGRVGVSILFAGFIAYTKAFIKLPVFFDPITPITLKIKFNC
jgi:hypothetical protein